MEKFSGVFRRFVLVGAMMASFLFVAAASIFGEAKWIGASGDDMPFYPDYQAVFKIDFDLSLAPDGCASVVYGIADPRLMNGNRNVYNIESEADSIGVKLTFASDGTIAVYRYGYHPADRPDIALARFSSDGLCAGENHITVVSNLGQTDIYVGEEKAGSLGMNPLGNGGEYIAFPVLGRMAVEIPADKARINNLTVSNYREPAAALLRVPGELSASSKISLRERAVPVIKKVFTVPEGKTVDKATVVSTARGIYDLYVNGRRVNDEFFMPGSTQYNKTHLYQTFDLTPFIKPGENELAVQLAEGWWWGPYTWMGELQNFYGDRPSFIGNIIIDYSDGSRVELPSEAGSWSVSCDGPLVVGSFFNGVVYDAAREAEQGRVWSPAVEISADSTVAKCIGSWDGINFVESFGNSVLPYDTITAVSMSEPRPGVYVYDMGQNMAAVPLIEFSGLKPGAEVLMRYAEVLYPDLPQYAGHKDMIMMENLRAAMCQDIYRASGGESEVFAPRTTLHGYRYVEITGIDEPLPVEAVRAVPVSSVHGFRADYECSDSLVNRLWKNIQWSTLGNFISIPTDCPQRNERLGWMGDISVFAPTATKLADVRALLRQFLMSVRDCQKENGRYPDVAPSSVGFGGLLWGSAGITVPWECYRQYADTALLAEHYQSMKKYINYILEEAIDPATGIIVQDRAWGDLADWLSPEYDKTDKSLLWECYFIYDLAVMRDVARVLGYDNDSAYYDGLYKCRKDFFADTYVDKETGRTRYSAFDAAKQGNEVDTQVSYALPIAMDIYSEPLFVENFLKTVRRENVADDGTLCGPYSLMTGFIGTAWLLEALSKAGYSEDAYRLLTATDYPSWLYPVTQGATTVWERLNSYTHKDGFGKNNNMNSFNHYSFGAVGNWLLSRSLGITTGENGEITVAPEVDQTGAITYASGWLETQFGRVESSWRRDGGEVTFRVDVPAGAKVLFKACGEERVLPEGENEFKMKCR